MGFLSHLPHSTLHPSSQAHHLAPSVYFIKKLEVISSLHHIQSLSLCSACGTAPLTTSSFHQLLLPSRPCSISHHLSPKFSVLSFPSTQIHNRIFRIKLSSFLERFHPLAAARFRLPSLLRFTTSYPLAAFHRHCSCSPACQTKDAFSAVIFLDLSRRQDSDTKNLKLRIMSLLVKVYSVVLYRWDALVLYLSDLPCIYHCFLQSTGPVLSLTSCNFYSNILSSQKSSSTTLSFPCSFFPYLALFVFITFITISIICYVFIYLLCLYH